ncbi:MAG: AI-2E family transporter [Methanobacterium sp.]
MLPNLKTKSISPLIILLVLFTLFSVGILFPILSLVILGAMIAYIVRPLAMKIKPFVKYETLAIFLAMAIIITPIIILLFITVGQILLVTSNIIGSLPSATNTTSSASTSLNTSMSSFNIQTLGPLDNIVDSILSEISKMIGQFIAWTATQIISSLAYIPTLFTEIIILLFSIFYFAKDGDKFVAFLKNVLPKNETFNKLYGEIDDILKSIMIVNVIAAVILGLLSVILYYILGYPYILLLGIITAIAEFIPVVGPWIVYGSLGIFDIITGNFARGIIVIVVGWVIDTVVDMYIRPRLAEKYTRVHPLVLLLGFIFGAITLGLPGLFIGPLIVGITYVIYQAYKDEKIKLREDLN